MPHKDREARNTYHREYDRRRRRDDPTYLEAARERHRRQASKKRDEKRILFAEFRRDGCIYCGEMEYCCLAAHHRDPLLKLFNVSGNSNRSTKSIRKELEKCDCVCHNCHAKIHAGVLSEYTYD